MIIAQGGAFGGWSLYLQDARPVYCFNLLGMQSTKVTGDRPVPAGPHEIRMEFAYDGGGPGRGGTVTLLVDGQPVGQGHVARTVPLVFSLDETCDIGRDGASPVSDDYTAEGSGFTGTVVQVRLELTDDAAVPNAMIDPQQRLKVAMARQ